MHCITLVITLTLALLQHNLPSWDEFKPRTFQEIIEQSSNLSLSTLEDGSVIFTRDKLPSRVKVTYVGKSRPISYETKEFIAGWVKMIARHPKIPSLFDSELLFMDGSNEWWLPVPNNGPNYAKELNEGQAVTLFVSRLGGKNNSGKIDWFFIVNNIEK
jgi:hypothetical protein